MATIKKIFPIIIIAIVCISLNLFLLNFGIYSLVETKLYDLRFKLRGPLTDWESEIVLLEIDDESYRLIPEPYPYPRGNVWSRIVINLSNAGAKVMDGVVESVRKKAYGTVRQPNEISGLQALKPMMMGV